MQEGVNLKKSEKDRVVENRAVERRAAKSRLFDVSLLDDGKEGAHAMPCHWNHWRGIHLSDGVRVKIADTLNKVAIQVSSGRTVSRTFKKELPFAHVPAELPWPLTKNQCILDCRV